MTGTTFGLGRTAMAAAVLLPLAAGTAMAKAPDGVTFPATMTVDGQTLVLNGVGTRTVSYYIDAYASALYLPQKASTEQAVIAEPDPKVLFTKYLHDATPDQTRTEFRMIYKKFCSENACPQQSEATFQEVLDHVQPSHVGDTSSYVFRNDGMTITHNGQTIFVVHDMDYAKGTLAALLGPASPTADFRNGLLGQD